MKQLIIILLFTTALVIPSFSQEEKTLPDTLGTATHKTAVIGQQVPSSQDSLVIKEGFFTDLMREVTPTNVVDTTTKNSHRQDPAFSGNRFYQTLGNQGLASKNLIFEGVSPLLYHYGIQAHALYQTTPDNLKVYTSYKPYTILDYAQGPSGDRREAQLNVDHGQYLAPNLLAGGKLYMNSSLGDYSRQKAQNLQLAFHGTFKSKHQRYAASVAYIHNKALWYNNFGIKHDSVFEQHIEPSRKLIVINNTKSESGFREHWFYTSQYLYLSNPQKEGIALGKIGLTSFYNRSKHLYKDTNTDTTFYPAYYHEDWQTTFDSTTITRFVNDLYWQSGKAEKRQFLTLKGGILLQQNNVSHYDSVFYRSNRLSTYGEITIRPDSASRIWVKTAFTTHSGSRTTKNLLLEGVVSRHFSFGHLSAKVGLFNTPPHFSLLRYHSAHYQWDHSDFKDLTNLRASLHYRRRTGEAGLSYHAVSHYTYLDPTILPAQAPEVIHLWKAWASQEFSLWRFDLSIQGIYQYISDPSIIHLPNFMGKMSVQFHQSLFNNALQARVGLDILYTTAFYGDAYAPELEQFYLQNELLTGNYPFMDAYLKIQVKRARIFLMLSHLNSGLMGYHYYFTPHYPMKDRYVKYGISWFFHD